MIFSLLQTIVSSGLLFRHHYVITSSNDILQIDDEHFKAP